MKAQRGFVGLAAGFAAALVLARLPILLTSLEVRKGAEELLVGVLPFHLMQGLILPVLQYQQEAYAGGTVATGLVVYPFFRLLGPTYLALKLAVLLFAVVAGLLYLAAVRGLAGTRAAALFAALYAIAPPLLQQHQVIAYGNHAELNVFLAAGLLLVLALYRSGGGVALGAALGVLSGFALFFDYAYAVFLAVLAGAWVLWRGARARTLTGFAPAAAVGLLPWFLFHHGWNVAAELGGMFVGRRYGWGKPIPGVGAWATIVDGFGGGGTTPLAAGWTAATYLAVAAALCVAGLVWERRVRARGDAADAKRAARGRIFLVLLAYVFLYVVVEEVHRLSLPDRSFRARYMVAAWPSLLVVLDLALDRLWTERRALAVLALAALLVPCAVEGKRLTGKAAARDLIVAPGYDYYYFTEVLGGRLGVPNDGVKAVRGELRTVLGGPADVLDEGLLAGAGHALGFGQGGRTARYCADAAACDPRFAVAAGAGAEIARGNRRHSFRGCPAPVPEEPCRRGRELAAAALAAARERKP